MDALDTHQTRGYRGRTDLVAMARVFNARMEADGIDERTSVEELAYTYEHLQRCDPDLDILIVERDGEMVGYGRTEWEDVSEGYRAYWMVFEAGADHALEREILDWVERRAGEIAAGHGVTPRFMEAWTDDSAHRYDTLAGRGYEPSSFAATLVRADLENIPDRPLPAGVEVRPVQPDDLRRIWEADVEAFRDHRHYVEQTEEDWAKFQEQPHWDPSLWQVAWAGEDVVGQVRSFIDEDENRRRGVSRGWTEDITTARSWRGQGIASSLICSSLRLLKDRGMHEAALGVDTHNLTGAFDLYRNLGFELVRSHTNFRRHF